MAGNAFQNTATEQVRKTLYSPTPRCPHRSELHAPLPLSLGSELILEEAFAPNCGQAEGRAFLLQETRTHFLVRKQRWGIHRPGSCGALATLLQKLVRRGKMSGWMRLSWVWILWLRRLWTEEQFSFRIRCCVSGPNLKRDSPLLTVSVRITPAQGKDRRQTG